MVLPGAGGGVGKLGVLFQWVSGLQDQRVWLLNDVNMFHINTAEFKNG